MAGPTERYSLSPFFLFILSLVLKLHRFSCCLVWPCWYPTCILYLQQICCILPASDLLSQSLKDFAFHSIPVIVSLVRMTTSDHSTGCEASFLEHSPLFTFWFFMHNAVILCLELLPKLSQALCGYSCAHIGAICNMRAYLLGFLSCPVPTVF